MRRQLFTLSMIAGACLLPAVALAAPRQEAQPAPQSDQAHGQDNQHQHHGAMQDAAHGQKEGASGSEVDVHRPGMKHDFSDVGKYSKGFDNPERVAWQKPDQVIALMAIEPGMTAVDIGAGTGFFEPFLAGAVGTSGKVLALDVEPNMIEHIKERAREAGLGQVEARLVATDDPGLAAGTVDRLIVVNTWHHIDDRGSYSAKLRAALRPGGAIYIVDFDKTSGKGPPAEHKLEPRQVIAELEAGGLDARQIDENLPEQYVVVARSR